MIARQERIINEMTTFTHDCLDMIFAKVAEKEDKIIHCMRMANPNVKTEALKDPFALYQGYIDIVKPVEYETNVQEYMDKIAELEQLLRDSEAKSDAIQSACEQYLREEKELKEKMASLE